MQQIFCVSVVNLSYNFLALLVKTSQPYALKDKNF